MGFKYPISKTLRCSGFGVYLCLNSPHNVDILREASLGLPHFQWPEQVWLGERRPSSSSLYSFPGAAATNHHHLCGLKQHKLTLLLFYWSEVQNRSHGAEAMCQLGCIPSGTQGRIHFSPFSISRSHLLSLASGSFFHLQSQQELLECFSHCTSRVLFSLSYLLLWLFKTSDYMGPAQIIQSDLPISRSLILITSAKLILQGSTHRFQNVTTFWKLLSAYRDSLKQ